MKNVAFFIILTLLSSLGFAQNVLEKIPIAVIDRLLFLEVKMYNSDPLYFMFDTGAGITVMDTETAERLKLPLSNEIKIGTSGKTLQAKLAENQTFLIGEKFKLDSVNVALLDLSHISKYLKVKIDGIIGIDLLQQAVVETNLDKKQLILYSTDNFYFQGQTKPMALIGLESNHLGLPIEIVPKGSKQSIAMIVKIDTAAQNYLTFHQHTVSEYRLIEKDKRYKTKIGFGADSTLTHNLTGKITSTRFAGKKWKNIPVVFEVDELNRSSDRKAHGLIGQKMLLDFNITYDLSKGLIYLEKRN